MQLALAFEADPILGLIHERLLAVHGPQRDADRLDPTSQCFLALLSARTLDAVSVAAFGRLTAALPSWDALPEADLEPLTAVIHDVTYAPEKAGYLVAAARLIRAECGRVDLAFLADWPLDAALGWLQKLPGIGPRNAATTLNFSKLRRPVLSIDSHMLRACWRLGLVASATDFAGGFRTLTNLVPNDWDADIHYEFHWLMKCHGQTTCRHSWPACGTCPLLELCRYRPAPPNSGESPKLVL